MFQNRKVVFQILDVVQKSLVCHGVENNYGRFSMFLDFHSLGLCKLKNLIEVRSSFRSGEFGQGENVQNSVKLCTRLGINLVAVGNLGVL